MPRGLFALSLVLSTFSLLPGCALPPQNVNESSLPAMASGTSVLTVDAELRTGRIKLDLYLPATDRPAPLVVVSHGWNRNRTTMVGWGRKLAAEGFVVAVPDAPAFADHPRNGRSIGHLLDWLNTQPEYSRLYDPTRIGLVGFSNGGLWTLLAAADNPRVKVWVGLDPVDRHNLGANAAPRLKAHAVVLKAPPSGWNKNGNCIAIERALPTGWSGLTVPNAIHLDPEWPTDPQTEMLLGKTSDTRRMIFVNETVMALKRELLNSPLAGS